MSDLTAAFPLDTWQGFCSQNSSEHWEVAHILTPPVLYVSFCRRAMFGQTLTCSRNAKVRVSSEDSPSIASINTKTKNGEAGLGPQWMVP